MTDPAPDDVEGWHISGQGAYNRGWRTFLSIADDELNVTIRESFTRVPLHVLRELLGARALSIVRSVCVPEERFGQCVPADANWSERVESAAALLLLAGPADLLAALRDAGIHIVDAKGRAVLEAMGSVPEWILKSRRIAAFDGLGEACAAELGRREAS